MTRQALSGTSPGRDEPPKLDTTVAHMARVYDYWLGGKDNFAVDREAAEEAIAAYPGIVTGVRANRAFLRRAIRFLADDAGIRQFLDIGTGIPTASNTHEVAQEIAPECRIVYVDNDPMVLLHARALLTSTLEGTTDYLDADVRDTDTILKHAARTLDFGQPVAISLLMILNMVPDAEDPWRIVSRLMDAVPAGSYLVVSHPASDLKTQQVTAMARQLNQRMGGQQIHPRPQAEVSRFFAGLDLMEPGVIQPANWRPDVGGGSASATGWCGVARKPLFLAVEDR
jgi:hypothetical protein